MAKEVGATVLGPCARPGGEDDWWKEQHKGCTGSHSLGGGEYVRCNCSCHNTSGAISFTIVAPVMHVSQHGNYSWCQKECETVADDYRQATCPECLKAILTDAYHFIGDEVRRPIAEFLDAVEDAREFAAETEIEAMARIILRNPGLWREELENRRKAS